MIKQIIQIMLEKLEMSFCFVLCKHWTVSQNTYNCNKRLPYVKTHSYHDFQNAFMTNTTTSGKTASVHSFYDRLFILLSPGNMEKIVTTREAIIPGAMEWEGCKCGVSK